MGGLDLKLNMYGISVMKDPYCSVFTLSVTLLQI